MAAWFELVGLLGSEVVPPPDPSPDRLVAIADDTRSVSIGLESRSAAVEETRLVSVGADSRSILVPEEDRTA